MKKILFGITSLTLGGAERVLVDIANNLCDKYDITIFTLYAKGELDKQLDERIKRKSLYQISYSDLSKIKKKILVPLRVLLLKKLIYHKKIKDDYNVEIAFLEGPITRLFSVKNKKTRKIAWIHNDISKVFGNGFKSKLKKMIDKKIYARYENLIFVSKDNLDKFNQVYTDEEIANKNKEVIYNYIDKKMVCKKAYEEMLLKFDKEKINFVTVARLVPQKAIDRLIKVHAKLINNGLYHNFIVIGDGPEKDNLQSLIKQEKIEDTFQLLGKMENPYPYIKNSTYFCLLSKFEGYGMVIEEAKILNKPIIITDTAAREAVKDYDNSIIVENSFEGIYDGLANIIKSNKKILNQQELSYDNSKILEKIIKLIG